MIVDLASRHASWVDQIYLKPLSLNCDGQFKAT